MMKQYSEQFLQKFPDVHGFEVKPTHISSSVQERSWTQIPGTGDSVYLYLWEKNKSWNLNFSNVVKNQELLVLRARETHT